ncbi:MAG: hypothetical protein C0606_09420 [Hyphomicrobiales bacterium]|nr:MAG: hypothetical protein C0606_09420 [Hyphomicrobiales bacterium]
MKRLASTLAFLAAGAAPAFAHFDPVAHGSLSVGLGDSLFGSAHVLGAVGLALGVVALGGVALKSARGHKVTEATARSKDRDAS